MAKGKMQGFWEIDQTAKAWIRRDRIGQFVINVLTVLAYVICVLWIVGVLPI